MKEFTKDQLGQIDKLNVQCSHSTGGYNYRLHWSISDGKINAYYFYEARDVDGDWGTAATFHDNITFDELLETIKNPRSKFDTRSWN